MRTLLLALLVAISFSASAQWYRIDLKFKKKVKSEAHPAPIDAGQIHYLASLPGKKTIEHPRLTIPAFSRSDYSYEVAESIVMKTAQHNMRFRVYNDASYNFSELANLYAQQNKLSEAKWFLLQSNLISREENDNKHTISNLIELATIKVNIGDYALAREDLAEAHDLSISSGLKDSIVEIEDMMLYIKQNGLATAKTVIVYSADGQNNTKAE